MGKMGQDAHGPFAPHMGLLPNMDVLPILDHILFLCGRFAPNPLGILPHTPGRIGGGQNAHFSSISYNPYTICS